jgi:hypothetical protein
MQRDRQIIRLIPWFFCLSAGVFLTRDVGIFAQTPRPTSPSNRAVGKFSLCGSDCGQAQYYIGYNRTNTAKIGEKESVLPSKPDTVLVNTSNLSFTRSLPDVDEKTVDLEDGNFVNSIHRIERAQIGNFLKTEMMSVRTNKPNSLAKATVKLFWGDTFAVTSKTLPSGTPVKVNIERISGGFGNPVTDYAHYEATYQTFIDGKAIADLYLTVAKKPGVGEQDKKTGKPQTTYTINTQVGATFTVESLLEVLEGVNVDAKSYQMLNGSDAIEYKIKLADETKIAACLTSASGTFSSGKCQ